MTISSRILELNDQLAEADLDLPASFHAVNPFIQGDEGHVRRVTTAFYGAFYGDDKTRRLILGSSPARRGTALTGVPFADAKLLAHLSGAKIDGYSVGHGSGDFLDEVIHVYGGYARFYSDFLMSFVCPIGLVRTNAKGRQVNANYYENKTLLASLRSFIITTLRGQIALGVDTSVCYCIGIGENFRVLSEINGVEHFFDRIEPLEHPRYIAQYNPSRKGEFVDKYLSALRR